MKKDGIVKVVCSKHCNNAPHLVYVHCDTPEAASTIETMLSQFSIEEFAKEKPFTVVTCDSPASIAEALAVAKTNTGSKHRLETVSMVTREMISYCNNLGPNWSFDVGTLKDFASRINSALDRLLQQRHETYMHLTQQIVQLETALKHARAESGPVDNAKSHKCTPECVCNDRMYQRRIASMQARIDSLMLEYCPEEMTPKQLATWELHQQPVPGTHPKDKK